MCSRSLLSLNTWAGWCSPNRFPMSFSRRSSDQRVGNSLPAPLHKSIRPATLDVPTRAPGYVGQTNARCRLRGRHQTHAPNYVAGNPNARPPLREKRRPPIWFKLFAKQEPVWGACDVAHPRAWEAEHHWGTILCTPAPSPGTKSQRQGYITNVVASHGTAIKART